MKLQYQFDRHAPVGNAFRRWITVTPDTPEKLDYLLRSKTMLLVYRAERVVPKQVGRTWRVGTVSSRPHEDPVFPSLKAAVVAALVGVNPVN